MQHLPMKICQASWCHGQDSHKVLPSEPIPSVDLYNFIHHQYQNKCLIHILVYLSMSTPQQLQFTAGTYTACQPVPSHAQLHLSPQPFMQQSTPLLMSMLSQKSDDEPHIAVKTQCNNTPNDSPQYTQVPLQEWAVFIYHQAAICISALCPIPSLRSVTSEDSCNIPSCFHTALQGIYSCQHHCDVWTDTTDLLKCYIYLYYF